MRRAFAILTALAALTMGLLPVIPGHDIPQHLAYVRLIAAWREGTYPAFYAPPVLGNGYVTVYVLLARLGAVVPVELALRLVLAGYVVALALAVRALVRATWEDDTTALLGPLVAFNPVLCMGLLAYVLALPPLVGAAAGAIGLARGRRGALGVAFGCAVLTGGLHAVAAAALVFFVGLLALGRRDRRGATAFAAVTAGALLGMRLAGGGASLPHGIGRALLDNIRVYGLVDGTLGTFVVSFTHWLEKANQILANVVGPFPLAGKLLAGVVLLAMIARRRGSAVPVRGVWLATGGLALAAVLAPAALQVPDDLSLLDFRLLTTATVLGIAAIPPGRLVRERAPFAVAALLALWTVQLRGAAGEIQQVRRLVARLGPDDRLLALPMHDTSAYLDERNAILHYAPVYHTVRTGGPTSLFWARYTPRLPIGYLPEHDRDRPPDWAPWLVTERQLSGYTHVLVRWPQDGDEADLRALALRVEGYRDRGDLVPIASDGDCSLFEIRSSRTASVIVE